MGLAASQARLLTLTSRQHAIEYKAQKLEAEKLNNTAFANILLGIMCMKNQDKKMSLKCNVIYSDDGDNHFWLLKSRN